MQSNDKMPDRNTVNKYLCRKLGIRWQGDGGPIDRKTPMLVGPMDFFGATGFTRLVTEMQTLPYWEDLKDYLVCFYTIEGWCHPDRLAYAVYDYMFSNNVMR